MIKLSADENILVEAMAFGIFSPILLPVVVEDYHRPINIRNSLRQ